MCSGPVLPPPIARHEDTLETDLVRDRGMALAVEAHIVGAIRCLKHEFHCGREFRYAQALKSKFSDSRTIEGHS